MTTTTYRYSISTEGTADLALSAALDKRLDAALDIDNGNHQEVWAAVEEAINTQIAAHGVTDDGEWLGEWSAEEIVSGILDTFGC
jgi:hypothetical protein